MHLDDDVVHILSNERRWLAIFGVDVVVHEFDPTKRPIALSTSKLHGRRTRINNQQKGTYGYSRLAERFESVFVKIGVRNSGCQLQERAKLGHQ
jgi:hypothetical protein